MNRPDTSLDSVLERTLGTATLKSSQRRRHLDRISERAQRGRFNAPRLLRDGAVAVVLIALMVGAWMVLPFGESSDSEIDPMAAIAAFREDVTEPSAPGDARYMRIDMETFTSSFVEASGPMAVDVWERVNENGFIERAIISHDIEGNVIGRSIEFEDRSIFELPGFWDDSPAGLLLIPPDPALAQPLGAIHLGPTSDQFDEFLSVAESEDGVEVTVYDDQIVIVIENPFEPEYGDTIEAEIGFPISSMFIEITLDPGNQQLAGWAFEVEGEEGQRYTLQSFRYSIRDEIDASEIPEDAFAERTELSEQEIDVPLPDSVELSFGTLEISDVEMRSPGFGTVTYLGPPPLLIEVRISPHNEEIDAEHPDVNPLEIPGVDGYWIPDQLREEDWPRIAEWADDELRFRLNARNLPEGGWTEDDLYELVQAIYDHNNP